MTVKEYTEEFYKLNIRKGHRESDDEKVARYMNGLRYDIQDEMSMVTIRMVEYAYQMMDHTSLVRNVENQKTYAMNPKEPSDQNNGRKSLRTENIKRS
jgi:hypothetical protein